ncbi:linoleate 13S-lipoxygenase 3-1, chloroplastic-like protein [Tanacetum coccineum]
MFRRPKGMLRRQEQQQLAMDAKILRRLRDLEIKSAFPDITLRASMLQSTKYMAVVDTLSTYSPDEEYIGERQQRDTWSGDAKMVETFYGFASEIHRTKKEIEKRNRDMCLKNRCGAGVFPYKLLASNSEPGVTCRGIPNSVLI